MKVQSLLLTDKCPYPGPAFVNSIAPCPQGEPDNREQVHRACRHIFGGICQLHGRTPYVTKGHSRRLLSPMTHSASYQGRRPEPREMRRLPNRPWRTFPFSAMHRGNIRFRLNHLKPTVAMILRFKPCSIISLYNTEI